MKLAVRPQWEAVEAELLSDRLWVERLAWMLSSKLPG